jgi:hypothetical protein
MNDPSITKYVNYAKELNKAKTAGTDPVGVIASYGKNALPEEASGKIDPTNAQDFLKEQISNLSNLKNDAVFLNDSMVKLSELKQRAIDFAKSQAKDWSSAQDAITQIKKLFDTKIIPNYKEYPNLENAKLDSEGNLIDGEVPLSEIDKVKTVQTGLSKAYNNSTAKPFELDAHGFIGKSARTLVEDLTDDVQTKELNNWISSHYNAIDLLEKLRGKTPTGGVLSKLIKQGTNTATGAIIGGASGHPLIGALAGHYIQPFIEGILGSDFISNPLKARIVNSMEIGDPAVVKGIQDYISQNMPDIKELGDYTLNNEKNTNTPSATPKGGTKTQTPITTDKINTSIPNQAKSSKSISETIPKSEIKSSKK